MLRRKPIYLVMTLIFFILLAYLGVRTLEHEVLLRQYQTQTLAKSQTASVARGIENILQQSLPATCDWRFYRPRRCRHPQHAQRERQRHCRRFYFAEKSPPLPR